MKSEETMKADAAASAALARYRDGEPGAKAAFIAAMSALKKAEANDPCDYCAQPVGDDYAPRGHAHNRCYNRAQREAREDAAIRNEARLRGH